MPPDDVKAPSTAATPVDPVQSPAPAAPGPSGEAPKAPDGPTPVAGATETPPVPPEKYDFKVPEGVEVSDEERTEVEAIAKEGKMSLELAQKVFDMRVSARTGVMDKLTADHVTRVADWDAQTRADTEIGGDKFEHSVRIAQKVINKFGSEGFGEMLRTSGYGSHPEVVRMMAKIGQAMSEDSLEIAGTPGGANGPQNQRKSIYNNPTSNIKE